MKSARYIIRLDDITPQMHWGRFNAVMQLLRRLRVKPLLGVIPDNRDTSLNVSSPRHDFWDAIKALHRNGEADIAQHGYQHLVTPHTGAALIGPRFGIKARSELTGLPLSEQLTKIQRGQEILKRNGIKTPYWMAPNHSFDRHTLLALRSAGFSALSDGVALFPQVESGLILLPQQLWRPRWMPTGIITICLHTNEITPPEVSALRRFLRQRVQITSFSDEVSGYHDYGTGAKILNSQFQRLVAYSRQAQKLTGWARSKLNPSQHIDSA